MPIETASLPRPQLRSTFSRPSSEGGFTAPRHTLRNLSVRRGQWRPRPRTLSPASPAVAWWSSRWGRPGETCLSSASGPLPRPAVPFRKPGTSCRALRFRFRFRFRPAQTAPDCPCMGTVWLPRTPPLRKGRAGPHAAPVRVSLPLGVAQGTRLTPYTTKSKT